MLKLLPCILKQTDFVRAENVRRFDAEQQDTMAANLSQAIEILTDDERMDALAREEPQAGKRWAVCVARDKLIKANSLLCSIKHGTAEEDFANIVEMLAELYDRRAGKWEE